MGLNKLIVIVGFAIFAVHSTQAASIGTSKSCICTREYFPICGSDGNTYSNKCTFNCMKEQKNDLEIKFDGECGDEPNLLMNDESCKCQNIYSPVCGSDDKTYTNECMLNCQKTKIPLDMKHVGECSDDNRIDVIPFALGEVDECVCTFVYEPVCGSDGKTYSSECEFNCAKKHTQNLEDFTKGECAQIETLSFEPVEKIEGRKCLCTREYSPICGSDGTTYPNKCTFNCIKEQNSDLEIKFDGECDVEPSLFSNDESCKCQRIYSPVCGSDDKTYTNECMLNCQKTKIPLDMKHVGECSDDNRIDVIPFALETDVCICTMDFAPVCGSDGRTYSNKCILGCEQRLRSDLKMKHIGEC